MTRPQNVRPHKPLREEGVHLATYPVTMGDRLRSNAALLDLTVRQRRLEWRDLIGLAEDLRREAAWADRFESKLEWDVAAVRPRRLVRLARSA